MPQMRLRCSSPAFARRRSGLRIENRFATMPNRMGDELSFVCAHLMDETGYGAGGRWRVRLPLVFRARG